MPRKHKTLRRPFEVLIYYRLGIELSSKVLFRDGEVLGSWKSISKGDESRAIPSGRSWILLNMSVAPEEANWTLPFEQLRPRKVPLRSRDLVRGRQLLFIAERARDCSQIFQSVNLVERQLCLCSHSLRAWVCGEWGLRLGEEMLLTSSDCWWEPL